MEHQIAIVSFEGAVKREVKRIREQLRADESLHEFEFDISIKGRVHDGDLKLTYELRDGPYDVRGVKGDSVNAVLDEFLRRRRGWTQRHAPKAIKLRENPERRHRSFRG